MDFFAHQDLARRNTRLLIAYYALAVALIVVAVYAVIALLLGVAGGEEDVSRPFWDPALFAVTAVALLAVIGLGTFFKVRQVARGGDFVARMLGGVRVDPSTEDPTERRLVNVVEEMAIASGIPAPAVYLLDERGINAFAAGLSTGDAVIGVTRGALAQLNRDELQGVIAHEFSHILYGDMRLNLRLMGVLHGILMIALTGYFLLRSSLYAPVRRSSRRDRDGGGRMAIIALGVALMAVGYIGVFFARLIKSAVSRQREFLADAAAVQFTRNPAGIGGALKRIAGHATGSRIGHKEAEEASHLFFANGLASAWLGLLATHPPLEERIRRIDAGLADGPAPGPAESPPPIPEAGAAGAAGVAALAGGPPPIPVRPAELSARVGQPTGADLAWTGELLAGWPAELRTAAHDPARAPLLIAALLLQPGVPDVLERQRAALQTAGTEFAEGVERLGPRLGRLNPAGRLPLLDLALASLRGVEPAALGRLRDVCAALVRADGRVSLFEFAVQRMLAQALEQRRNPGRRGRVDFPALRPLRPQATTLFSALARQGKTPEAAYAAAMRRLGFEPAPPPSDAGGLDTVTDALADLERAAPAVKRRIIEACAVCVATDGAVALGEAELLRAVAAALDCPMPPLHGGARREKKHEGKS